MADATRIQIPAELERKMDEAIARYPSEHRRSAAMPLLHLWQEHFGFIGDEAIFWIAEKLGLQPINILEVVTFYPMFRQHPAGKTHIRICRTLSCAMAGGLEVMENLCENLGIQCPNDGEETHNPIAVSADGNTVMNNFSVNIYNGNSKNSTITGTMMTRKNRRLRSSPTASA